VSTYPRRDRVLVVDDAANLRELLTLLLDTEDDFEVIGTASNGEQALAVAEALLPDIILLDLAMPVMDGMKALPALRELLPASSIVIFSGFEQIEQNAFVEQAIAAGADAYLEKAASVTALVDVLRELRAGTTPA
jgi:DNA-binding NarL/FixJ family response regulator